MYVFYEHKYIITGFTKTGYEKRRNNLKGWKNRCNHPGGTESQMRGIPHYR